MLGFDIGVIQYIVNIAIIEQYSTIHECRNILSTFKGEKINISDACLKILKLDWSVGN